jgi:hypothetical protein
MTRRCKRLEVNVNRTEGGKKERRNYVNTAMNISILENLVIYFKKLVNINCQVYFTSQN